MNSFRCELIRLANGHLSCELVGAEPSDIECSTDRLRTQEEAAGREPDEAAFRKRLERIASGRKDGKPRKLTEEEEHLIEDIIQEYLYE